MQRREFFTLLGGAVAGWPLGAHAQQPAMPVVGFLNVASAASYAPQLAAFLKGLGETGYVDGRNVTIEYRYAVPAIFENREFTVAGGLTSYSGSIIEAYRLAGVYTGRVLKGDKPIDLPVLQATKVELFINLKTAKALGITVPLPLSGRADELFE
jgi:hypothetical protein